MALQLFLLPFPLYHGNHPNDKWLVMDYGGLATGGASCCFSWDIKTQGNRGQVHATELERLTGRKTTIIKHHIYLQEKQQRIMTLCMDSEATWPRLLCIEVIGYLLAM